MNQTSHKAAPVEQESMVDAVLSASRVLVAIAARSLADPDEEVTLTQYRSLVVLASRGPQSMATLAEAVAVTPATASRLSRQGTNANNYRPDDKCQCCAENECWNPYDEMDNLDQVHRETEHNEGNDLSQTRQRRMESLDLALVRRRLVTEHDSRDKHGKES
jgi:hypothetical protein